ncbi:phage tail protein [Anaeromicropila populeti]|uniref:Conserved hypothetical phage tail region protein n=1 Tax=Anaeromicropila populeti TaxID=37658 RepID=A0A1I6HI12_9FIRM|nr:phage tail protein [Anaeromicropila populeti]SFR54024.1 conserved hypothetical phage tail region protein [Anaeromicropila populeti]
MNTSRDYITGCEFEVYFDDVVLSFTKVSNIETGVEVDAIMEGGNPNPVLIRNPKKQADRMIFEKGVLVKDASTDKFSAGKRVSNVLIFIKMNGEIIKKFCFDSGMIVSKKYDELDALSNRVYIEKLEIAHSGLQSIL